MLKLRQVLGEDNKVLFERLEYKNGVPIMQAQDAPFSPIRASPNQSQVGVSPSSDTIDLIDSPIRIKNETNNNISPTSPASFGSPMSRASDAELKIFSKRQNQPEFKSFQICFRIENVSYQIV